MRVRVSFYGYTWFVDDFHAPPFGNVLPPMSHPTLLGAWNPRRHRHRGGLSERGAAATGPGEAVAHRVAVGVLEAQGVLGDQDAGARGGCVVEFFGRPAACHKSIALFSLTSGAPMAVIYTFRCRQPLRFKVEILGVADPADKDDPRVQGVLPLTQWYSSKLEEAIRIMPEQYWWLHDRWKEYCGKRRHRLKRIHGAKRQRVISSHVQLQTTNDEVPNDERMTKHE